MICPSLNKNICLLISSRIVSNIGNWLNRIAILTLVYELNNSAISMSLVSLAMLIPCLILGPFSGKVADKYNQKYIMMISDLINALLVFMIPFFKDYVLIILIAISVISTFSDVCDNSIVPFLIKDEDITKVNSINSTVGSMIMVIGPSLSGLIIASIGLKFCFILDSLSFLISFFIIFKIDYKKNISNSLNNNIQTKNDFSFKKSLIYIKNNNKLLSIIINSGIVGLAAGMLNSLLIVYVYDYLNQNSVGYGVLLSSKGIAMIICSIFIYKFTSKISNEFIFKFSLIGLGIVSIIFPLNNIFYIALVLQSLNGIFNCGYSISKTTLIQTNCQNDKLGRVFSINSLISNLTSIASLGVFGVLADIIGVRTVLIIGGIIVLCGGIISSILIHSPSKDFVEEA